MLGKLNTILYNYVYECCMAVLRLLGGLPEGRLTACRLCIKSTPNTCLTLFHDVEELPGTAVFTHPG
jgi:hypothetical protein